MNHTHYPFWPKRLPKFMPIPQVPLHDLLETSARRYPDRTAMIYYGTDISYHEFWKQALQFAGSLYDIGIRTGDRVAEDEADCLNIIRQFLSYLPSHCMELPPVATVPPESGAEMPRILDLLPEKRNRTYDMHKIILCIVDSASLFPVKPTFGQAALLCHASKEALSAS